MNSATNVSPFTYQAQRSAEDADTSPWISKVNYNHGHLSIREGYKLLANGSLNNIHDYIIRLQNCINKADIFLGESDYEKKDKLNVGKDEDIRMIRHAEQIFNRKFEAYLDSLHSLFSCEKKEIAPESEDDLLALTFEKLALMDGDELEMTISNLDLKRQQYINDKSGLNKIRLERTMECVKQISARRFKTL